MIWATLKHDPLLRTAHIHATYASGDPTAGPTGAPKPLPFQVIGVGVVLNAWEVLIDQRLEEGLLGGMWEFGRAGQGVWNLLPEQGGAYSDSR